jgi:hypothetical protein
MKVGDWFFPEVLVSHTFPHSIHATAIILHRIMSPTAIFQHPFHFLVRYLPVTGRWSVWFTYGVALTNSMEPRPFWETTSCSVTYELPSISWKPKVHYRVHKSPPLTRILSQLDPVHTPTRCFFEINCLAFPLATCRCCVVMVVCFHGVSYRNFVRFLFLSFCKQK